MARYIDVDKLTDKLEELQFNAPVMTPVMKIYNVIELVEDQPTADVVSTKAFEQVKWERDTAIEQLESYGVGFCENKELAEVVRCKNCVKAIKESEQWKGMDKYFCERHHSFVVSENYCSYGERRDT